MTKSPPWKLIPRARIDVVMSIQNNPQNKLSTAYSPGCVLVNEAELITAEAFFGGDQSIAAMEDRRIVRFVKFHGYLFLLVTLSLVFHELWTVTLLTFDFSEQSWASSGLDVTLRGHPVVRWIFVLAWLAALAFMLAGMKWEDAAYLQPAKYVFLVELVALLARDLLYTIEGDPEGRFIYNLRYLFYLSAIVVYVLYSFYALRTLFGMNRSRNLGLKTIDSRLAIVNMRKV